MTRILDCTIISFHKIRSLLMSQVVCLKELIVFSLCWYCHIDPFLLSNLSFSRIVYQPQHMDHSSACAACWLVTPWSERTQDKGILKHKCGDSLCSRSLNILTVLFFERNQASRSVAELSLMLHLRGCLSSLLLTFWVHDRRPKKCPMTNFFGNMSKASSSNVRVPLRTQDPQWDPAQLSVHEARLLRKPRQRTTVPPVHSARAL